jgi:hypothetical protein
MTATTFNFASRHLIRTSFLCLAAAICSPAAAEGESAAAAPVVESQTAAQTGDTKPAAKPVCKKEKVLGSHMYKTTCRTPQEAAAQHRASADWLYSKGQSQSANGEGTGG